MPSAETDLRAGISNFSCAKDCELEDFLGQKAILFERIAKCRTYLLVDEEALGNRMDILGFFSIAIHSLSLPKSLSKQKIRMMDGYSAKNRNKVLSSLPAFLIGQLAKNDVFASRIKGDDLLRTAMATIAELHEAVGGRFIAIDCKPIHTLTEFYERNGFVKIGYNEDVQLDQYVFFLNHSQVQGEDIVEF